MRYVWILGLVMVFAFGCRSQDGAGSRPDLMIANVAVVSANDLFNTRRMDVLVHNGRILALEEAGSQEYDPTTPRLDGTDRFLIPGLIDGHTHLNEVPGMTFEHERQFPDIASAARMQIPRSYLYHGFTTIIDLNSTPETIDEWNAVGVRPKAYFCGAAPAFDGYPMSWMPKEHRYDIMPYFLYDESRKKQFPEGIDPARHMPDAVVDRIAKDGGICVKTHFEPGFGGRGDLPVPTLGLMRALVESAHSRNLPVLMHANSQTAQAFGVQTNIDAFAHGMWTWNDRSLLEIRPEIVMLIEEAIAKGIALQPTIQVLYGEQDLHDPNYLSDSRLKRVLPQSLIDWYKTEDGQWWRQRMLRIPIVSQLVEEGKWQELDAPPIARVSAMLKYFADNDGALLFGSDTPSDPTFANPPGLNGRIEMDRWVEAGVRPAQVFTAATMSNAEFYGLHEEIGTIEPGKKANLLLLRENPVESVTAYDSIEWVILEGKLIERSSLAANAD